MKPDDEIVVEALGCAPVAEGAAEIVERKGLGHPDTICDSVAEAASQALCAAYVERFGRVLHHNLDKALLVPGRTQPAFGGGRMLRPMRLLLSGQATASVGEVDLPVAEIVLESARAWVRAHLRDVVPERDLRVEELVAPGSSSLVGLFASAEPGANDTSVGVGYAPLSPTERMVLAAEAHLRSAAFRERFPAAGEDVKVMAIRRGHRIVLTVAVAFVGRHVASEERYFELRHALRQDLAERLEPELDGLEHLELVVNALDRRGGGAEGVYLTVLGTSAEAGDGGQVGRGNRANGLIAFQRPTSLEAVAGKNPTSHVGKIYNLLAFQIAERLQGEVEGVREARVLLCSRIGAALSRPALASVQVVPARGVALSDVEGAVRERVAGELAGVGTLVESLVRGEREVC